MAKKPRGGKHNDDTVNDDEVETFTGELPDKKALDAHFKSLSTLNAKAAEVRGQIGAQVKAAESDHNIHRGAASLMTKLIRMDAAKRDDFLRHFDSYRLQLGYGRQDNLFGDNASPAEKATFDGRAAN